MKWPRAPVNRRFIAAFVLLLVVTSAAAYIANNSYPSEQFFQMYVLGPTGEAAGYYPNNSSTFGAGTPVRWQIRVTNFQGSVQFVEVVLKLGNFTSLAPNEYTLQPSDAPVIASFQQILVNNATWDLPVNWQILSVSYSGRSAALTIDVAGSNKSVTPAVSATDGLRFRIIIELWTYDASANSFIFGWMGNGEHKATWLQLWFNVTSPTNSSP